MAGSKKPSGVPVDRARLMRFYQKYNPSKLSEIDSICSNWQERGIEIFEALVKKYGPEPPNPNAASSNNAAIAGASAAKPFQPAAAAVAPPAAQWTCPACTFVNKSSSPRCEMCDNPAPPRQAPQQRAASAQSRPAVATSSPSAGGGGSSRSSSQGPVVVRSPHVAMHGRQPVRAGGPAIASGPKVMVGGGCSSTSSSSRAPPPCTCPPSPPSSSSCSSSSPPSPSKDCDHATLSERYPAATHSTQGIAWRRPYGG